MKHFKWHHWLALISCILWAIVIVMATHAKAQEDRWGHWVYRPSCDGYGYCHRVLVWRRIRYYHHRYYGYSQPTYYHRDRDYDDYRDEHRGLCMDREVEVVSTEHQSEEHARDAARKLWMASTNWSYGGRYMDLDNAADVRWRCGPSSAMDNLSGKISQAAQQLVGRDGQNVRCQLWARPCELPREKERDRRR